MASTKSFIPQDAVKAYQELNAALEQNNKVLSEHFNELQKVAGEFSKVSVSQKDLLAAITRYEQVVKSVNKTQTEQARIVSQLEKLEQRQAAMDTDEGKRLSQKKTDLAAIQREQKLLNIVASEYTTALEKLYAKQELANRAAQKYLTTLGAESKEYKQAIADTKRYAQEINQMEVNTGKLVGKTTSMYGATYQLTQVMRELPNFAMDARIGFMALSNNLPMLQDAFSRLSKQIDETTGKPYGAAGAFKIFAKSLLSWNTVLITASTLLVMYGDKLMEVFTGKVSAAEQAHRDFIKSLEEGSNAVSQNISDLARLRAYLTLLDGEYVTQEDILKTYNETIGNVIGKTDDFATAQQNIIEKGDGYIAVMLQMAAANGILEQATKEVMRAEALRQEQINGWQAFWKGGGDRNYLKYIDEDGNARQFDRVSRSRQIVNSSLYDDLSGQEIEDMLNKEQTEFNKMVELAQRAYREMREEGESYVAVRFKNLVEAEKIERESIKNAKESYMDMMERVKKTASESGIENPYNFNRDTDKDGKSAAKTLRTIFIELDAYSKERQRLTEEMKRAEEASEKETASSTVNAYEIREQAMRRYYEASKKLADLDYNESVAKAEQELNKEIERIEKAREYNKKALDAGKATEEEYSEASAKLLQAEQNANKNYDNAVLKAHDDRLNAMYDLDVDYRQKLSALWEDIAEDASYDASRPTGLSTVAQGIGGYQPNTELAELRAAHEEKMRLIDEEIERRKKAGEDVTAFEIDKINELNEYKKQSERSAQEQLQEIEVEIVETTYNMLKDLAASYYEAKLEANEEWAEKENERVDALVKSERISEEQGEARKQAIENMREKREKELKRKQAISERAFAAFEIGINTAAAIMQAAKSVAPPWNVPLIAAMATLGAAQLAAVLATPIPQYAHGTEDHPGGLAVVGDAGKHELVVLPDGTLLKTPKRPTLLDLPPHAEVFPDFSKAMPDLLPQPQADGGKYTVVVNEDKRLVELTKENNKLLRRIAAKDTVIINKQARNYNLRN